MPTKVIESTRPDSIIQAMNIWMGIKGIFEDATTDKAILESELSEKTWIDCTGNAYTNHTGKYQRLNDAVKNKINELAKEDNKQYPLLKRHHNRIGRMTLSGGHIYVNTKVKCAGTNMKNAIAVNEGLGLGRNVPQEIASDFTTKLIEGGYDPGYAARLAIETVKEIEMNTVIAKRLGKVKRKKLLKGICEGVLEVLSSRPALIQKDQELVDKGMPDTLAKSNKNVKVKQNDQV